MADPTGEYPASARWLHRLAVLTVLAALPLVLLGAEVTSKKVGMADPVWPTAPWYLLGNPSLDRGIGFVIEHSHRLAGWTVGFCVLALTVGLWMWEPRRWLCWLGTAAGCGVLLQGMLGGMRVVLHAWFGPDLALIHGCVGQMVFALLVCVAVCASASFSDASEKRYEPAFRRSVAKPALLLVGLVVLQLFLGALMRHKEAATGKYGHLLVAFAVVGTAVWLIKDISDHHAENHRLYAVSRWLGLLIVVQLLLGVEAWMIRFAPTPVTGLEHWLLRRDLVRSVHVLVGAGILATSAVLALESLRQVAWATRSEPTPAGRLEGAA